MILKYITCYLLRYPVVYSVFILPLSIVRWMSFVSPDVHFSLTTSFAVVTLFSLAPASNVVVTVLLITKIDSVVFGKPKSCYDSPKYSVDNLTTSSKDGENIGA